MNLKIYSIKDVVVDSFNNPFYLHNDAECVRFLKSALKNNAKEFADKINDLELYGLGEFDTETGIIKTDVHRINSLKLMANQVDIDEAKKQILKEINEKKGD